MKEVKKEASIEVILTTKQRSILAEIVKEKIELEQQTTVITKKEVIATTLILDAHNINIDECASIKLNQEEGVFTVIKKSEKKLEEKN